METPTTQTTVNCTFREEILEQAGIEDQCYAKGLADLLQKYRGCYLFWCYE